MDRCARVRYGHLWAYDLEDVGDDPGFFNRPWEGQEVVGRAFAGWYVGSSPSMNTHPLVSLCSGSWLIVGMWCVGNFGRRYVFLVSILFSWICERVRLHDLNVVLQDSICGQSV